MTNKKLFRNRHGVAGVIEALLMIALVVLVLSTIQLTYIPQIMKQKETDHMDEVSNQFSNLKSVIDTQSLMGSIGTSEPIAYTPMTSPITLGSDKLPYLISIGAQGDVIIPDNACKIKIEPQPSSGSGFYPLAGMYSNSIKYNAHNHYLDKLNEQTFLLECGGIILFYPLGDGDSVMRVDPSISVINGSKISISFYAPRIIAGSGKNISEGNDDTAYIRTNFSNAETYTHGDITYMRIYSDYISAWYGSLYNHSLLGKYSDEGYVNIDLDTSQPPEYVEITPAGKEVEIEIIVVKILAQVGPGWTR